MKRVPLRRRLLLLVATGLLPVALLSAVGLHALYQEQRRQTERTALEVARAMSTAVDSELEQSMAALAALSHSFRLDDHDLETFRRLLERVGRDHPGWLTIVLADPSGKVLLATGAPDATPVGDVIEPESLREAVRTRKPVVGTLARGRGGRWAFAVRVPVIREGRVVYVLSAAVSPDAVLAVATRQDLASGWVVTSVDTKGNRVMRWPRQAEYIGTPVSGTLQKMMETGAPQGTGITNTSEGTPVFTAFSRSPQTGWAVAVGIPVAVVEWAALRSALAVGAGLFLSLILGAWAAWLVARSINRPMEALRDAARDVGAGRTPHPTSSDIREVQEVSEALADASRQRDEAGRQRDELLRREKAARASAEAANRAKDEFLAMLGHELRNPLGAISNASILLDTAGTQAGIAARARGIISRQVSHLSRLTDDLLDASRALTGKIPLRREPMDLCVAALQTITTLKASGRLGSHHVVHDLRSAWIDADPVRVDQVITNLLVNAAKYTPEGGAIHVGVKPDGHEAVLTVADDGIGMTPELAARAFELFVQGERELHRSEGGLGIGLTLVRRLVEMHGGRVAAYSEGENRGSEFVVRLPTTPRPATFVEPPPTRSSGARSILVVEDNDDGRESLRMLLEAHGHEVETASDGLVGLEKALTLAPEIALIDIGLPGLDGYELARRVRKASMGARTFMVAVTGYGAPEDRDRAFAAGFDAHVPKPVDRTVLATLLASAARALDSARESPPSR